MQVKNMFYYNLVIHLFAHKNLISFISKENVRRLVQSVSGAKSYTFTVAFDSEFIFKGDMEIVFSRSTRLYLPADSQYLLEMNNKYYYTKGKYILIYIENVRDV